MTANRERGLTMRTTSQPYELLEDWALVGRQPTVEFGPRIRASALRGRRRVVRTILFVEALAQRAQRTPAHSADAPTPATDHKVGGSSPSERAEWSSRSSFYARSRPGAVGPRRRVGTWRGSPAHGNRAWP